jgi:hypothetical protein
MGSAWKPIALHSTAAAAFFYMLQRYGLHATVESSIFWALAMGIVAGLIAWRQVSR